MRPEPFTLAEFANIIAETEGREAEPILTQLRNARELLLPTETRGARGAWLFAGEEICAARLLLALLDAGSQADDLRHLTSHFRSGRKIDGVPVRGVEALIRAIRNGDERPWALHFWTLRLPGAEKSVGHSGVVMPLDEVLEEVRNQNDPHLIAQVIIPASGLVAPLLERIEAAE